MYDNVPDDEYEFLLEDVDAQEILKDDILLYTFLLKVFFLSNKMMLMRDYSEIKRDIAERSVCANLKEMMNILLRKRGFYGYYADVEYNRGGDKLVKAIYVENEKKPIQCDLIIHSRGQKHLDNLLCIEMKKKGGENIEEDKTRLIELTKREIHFKNKDDHYYYVFGYKLGVFYMYDYENEEVYLEFYKEGRKVGMMNTTLGQLLSHSSCNKAVEFLQGPYCTRRQYTLYPARRQPFLVFFNMDFGDSFLVSDRFHGLLVDCGSYYNMPSSIWRIRKRNIMNFLNWKNDLLITHYHRDHISYLADLCKSGAQFDKIYVRNLGSVSFAFDISSVFVELALYAVTTNDYNTLFFWLNPYFLYNVLKPGEKIVGVNNAINSTVNIGGMTANILWPAPAANDATIYKKVRNFSFSKTFKKCPSTFEYLGKLIDLYSTLFERSEQKNEFYLDEVETIASEKEIVLSEEVREEIIKEIIAFFEDGSLQKIRKKLSDIENYLSIVFSIGEKLLMTGDATKRAMSRALKPIPKAIFEYVKVPHHGTTRYLLKKHYDNNSVLLIPNSLLCNGWKIDPYYLPHCRICHSLNSSSTTACPHAMSGTCPYASKVITDYKMFKL